METLESLRRKISTATDLHSIVKTMKAMASVNIRHYENAVISIQQYREAVERGIQIVLQHGENPVEIDLPALSQGKTAFIVMGSDQGMVGQFNQVVVNYALDEMKKLLHEAEDGKRPKRILMGVGLRAAARLEQGRQPVDVLLHVPGSLAGITGAVYEFLFHIEAWRAKQGVERVYIIHNTPQGGAAYHPVTRQLLPVNPAWLEWLRERDWEERTLPTFRADGNGLFLQLLRESFFLLLYRAMAESLASENASRLAAMSAAERNIEERIDLLQHNYHQQRQTSITEEILDVITGFEALKNTT